MKNLSMFCAVLIATVCLSANASGQDNGFFSGQGVRMPEKKKTAPPKSKWPKLLDFSKDDPQPAKQNSGLFANQPTFKMPSHDKSEKSSFDLFKKNPDSMVDREQPKPFSGITDMFPKRDPNQPSLFSQMNTKSKNFWDRTTGWTKNKNQKMREKSTETWDSITRDMRQIEAQTHDESYPAQPPVRTAEGTDKPRIRF